MEREEVRPTGCCREREREMRLWEIVARGGMGKRRLRERMLEGEEAVREWGRMRLGHGEGSLILSLGYEANNDLSNTLISICEKGMHGKSIFLELVTLLKPKIS